MTGWYDDDNGMMTCHVMLAMVSMPRARASMRQVTTMYDCMGGVCVRCDGECDSV